MAKKGNPTQYEQLNGSVMWYTNAPETKTGYGRQIDQLVTRMTRHGIRTAVHCNYGQEGEIGKYKTKHGDVTLYPKSYTGYSVDMTPVHYKHFMLGRDEPSMLMTLYDTWVLHQNKKFDELEIHSWTPVDHSSVPLEVASWVKKPNVKPIAMAPDGQRQMSRLGVEAPYIPHTIDTKVYKPGHKIDGASPREFFQLKDDDFLFGMVAANKANSGLVHRKAYAENIMAFGVHVKKYPNSYLYIHAEPTRALNGFDLGRLLKVNNIPQDNVIFPDNVRLRYGFSDKEMAAIYEGMDFLLGPSYGEGFQVPLIEAMSVGTRVIASTWTAPPDLISKTSYGVTGQLFWDENQGGYYQVPNVGSIVAAMEEAYNAPRERCEVSIDWAKQFDIETVWMDKWLPYFREHLTK